MHLRSLSLRTLTIVGLVCFVARAHSASKPSDGSSRPTGQVKQSSRVQGAPASADDDMKKAAQDAAPEKEEPKPEPKKEEPKPEQPSPNQQPQQPPPPLPPSRPSDDEFEFDQVMPKSGTQGAGNCTCKIGEKPPVPGDVVDKVLKYYKSNRPRITGSDADRKDYHMAINDYSHATGCMYIISLEGDCLYALNADYGVGSKSNGSPMANCENKSLGTPSGFHVTGPHPRVGSKYDTSNSMEMVDLQRQGSRGRGILIHQGSWAGGAGTWGCSGVSKSKMDERPQDRNKNGFDIAREQLPYGSLVYNYFPENKRGNCPPEDVTICERPAGAPSPSSGGGSNAAGARP